MDAGDYLASINWLGAVVVGGVLVVVGLVLPGAGEGAAKAILDARGDLPVDSWVCSTCRSVNTPRAKYCYRGCGERDDLARPLPEERSDIADGHNGRRNL
jgi:hypothetical protein